uniref:Potassium/proton antiporter n=1 Tax=Papaver somniferum TaxID=3469 RepID=A0A5B7LK88_PAPSO|nr:potassium/proton antiporter [Papaver somniferum]
MSNKCGLFYSYNMLYSRHSRHAIFLDGLFKDPPLVSGFENIPTIFSQVFLIVLIIMISSAGTQGFIGGIFDVVFGRRSPPSAQVVVQQPQPVFQPQPLAYPYVPGIVVDPNPYYAQPQVVKPGVVVDPNP